MLEPRLLAVNGKAVTSGNAVRKLGWLLFYSALLDDYGTLENTDEERQRTFSVLFDNAKQRYKEKKSSLQTVAMPEY